MVLRKKTQKNIIQIRHEFLTIHRTTLIVGGSGSGKTNSSFNYNSLFMTIYNKIKDEKLKYDINTEAAKLSALSSGKIDKYECLTDEEILPSDQNRIIQQATFTYCSFYLKSK